MPPVRSRPLTASWNVPAPTIKISSCDNDRLALSSSPTQLRRPVSAVLSRPQSPLMTSPRANAPLTPLTDALFASPRMLGSPQSAVERELHAQAVKERRNMNDHQHMDLIVDAVQQRKDRREQRIRDKVVQAELAETIARQELWLQIAYTVFLPAHLKKQRDEMKQKKTFSLVIVPMLLRWIRVAKLRRQRTVITKTLMGSKEKPTHTELLSMQFFKGWGRQNLDRILASMTPRGYAEGECVAHEGDFGNEMFILAEGAVEVLVLSKKTGIKKRNHQNGFVVFTLQAPAVFGEFTILCNEARSATLKCKGNVSLWVIHQDALLPEISLLPEETKLRIMVMTEERRAANLLKMHKLRVDQVVSLNIFKTVDHLTAETIASAVRPKVIRQGAVIYKEGEKSDTMYILTNGAVKLSRQSTTSAWDGVTKVDDNNAEEVSTIVTPLSAFGVGEVLFAEQRSDTAVAMKMCEVWFLTKDVIVDILMTKPDDLLVARRCWNDTRSLALKIPPLGNLLKMIPSMFCKMLQPHWRPRIYGALEDITTAGHPIDRVVVLMYGKAKEKGVVNVSSPLVLGLEGCRPQPSSPNNSVGTGVNTTTDGVVRWEHTLKAITRCECAILPKKTFLQVWGAYERSVMKGSFEEEDIG